MPTEPRALTGLLNRMQQGDRSAGEEAAGLVYQELRHIAASQMRRERPGHVLQTTALVHEAYLRMVGSTPVALQNRGHFFAIASQQMRRILVDHARAAGAERRGGGAGRIGLEHVQLAAPERNIDVLALDEALNDLERIDARAARVVELRYFGGYTDKEAAEALGVPFATVRRDWEYARSWLFDRMRRPDQAQTP